VADDEVPATTTVRDRLTAAGLSDERIEQHTTAGRVRVDGELFTDLDTPPQRGRLARRSPSELHEKANERASKTINKLPAMRIGRISPAKVSREPGKRTRYTNGNTYPACVGRVIAQLRDR
jgi:hypothetical protein